ncbi:MAG: heavy metal-responsive transcriptional regulator [Acidithiobacillus sp.]
MVAITIGRLARESGLAPETLRYYERLGLIQPSQRTRANYRLYGRDAEGRLRFIRRAQGLGFSLAEIRDLLGLHAAANEDMARVKALAQIKIAEIDAKISDLQQMRTGLAALSDLCPGHGPTAACPILAALLGDDVPAGHGYE